MTFLDSTRVLRMGVTFKLKTNLLLRSGRADDVADNTVDTTPDKKALYIKGEVWASLLRRALLRIKGGQAFAQILGNYEGEKGISPFWFEDSVVPLPGWEIRTGNRIHRRWGSTETGALYSEESAPAHMTIPMTLRYFSSDDEDEASLSNIREKIREAFWVIHQGIENMGGGWSYGFGRLDFQEGRFRELNLKERDQRNQLWDETLSEGDPLTLPNKMPEIVRPWKKIRVSAGIADGQLLGIHTATPPLSRDITGEKLPDAFVYTRSVAQAGGGVADEMVITGKAFRQALLSTPIERELRTRPGKKGACLHAGNQGCKCTRCIWFGSTDAGGIIAVLDAPIKNPEPIILNRIAVCEHSMQNDNLFSGEYLAGGSFDVEVLVDCARDDADVDWQGLLDRVTRRFNDMHVNNIDAPPGWDRLGGTATCTGQVAVMELKQENHGGPDDIK